VSAVDETGPFFHVYIVEPTGPFEDAPNVTVIEESGGEIID